MGNLSPASGPDLDFYIRETDIYGNETAEWNQLQLSQMEFALTIKDLVAKMLREF
jgi:hypothetical protein